MSYRTATSMCEFTDDVGFTLECYAAAFVDDCGRVRGHAALSRSLIGFIADVDVLALGGYAVNVERHCRRARARCGR